MPRRRKSEDDDTTNARIGDALLRLRKERGWTLQYVARSLELSVPHVSALESGQYTFSAALVEKLVKLFQRPLSVFLVEDFVPDTLAAEWQVMFGTLPDRDRWVLLDLARKITSWRGPRVVDVQDPASAARHPGRLVALEGIDGEHLQRLGAQLVASSREGSATLCSHDYRTNLWRYIIEHSAKLDRKKTPYRALERTMLFACERLLRNESCVEPALRSGQTVVAPFFSMAPYVYQEMEGSNDRRIADLVEALLPKPDVVVLLRSDPVVAAKKAVRQVPKSGQFYSDYGRDQLRRAASLYEKSVEELRGRGVAVHVLDASQPLSSSMVHAIIERGAAAGAKNKVYETVRGSGRKAR